MKKIILALVIVSVFLTGCTSTKSALYAEAGMVAQPKGIFHVDTSYFDQYHAERVGSTYKVSGRIYQGAEDQNGILTFVTVPAIGGCVTVTGNMDCVEGNIRLVYTASDKTEILIAEGSAQEIDVTIDLPEGKGVIGFAGDGESAVCEFIISMKAGEGVALKEDGESTTESENREQSVDREETEAVEKTESMEQLERVEQLEDIESLKIKELADNWPESICYHADGLYADPLSTEIEIDTPMTLSVSGVTLDGSLRLEIVNDDTDEVCFEEKNPDGEYTVTIEKVGTYQVLFYAKEHVGRVDIVPEKN